MNIPGGRTIVTLAVAAMVVVAGSAEVCGQEGAVDTVSLNDYDITQYASVKSFSPKQVMFLDNNDQLLLFCRGGKTRSQLDAARIEYNDSQLALLRAWRLIEKHDSVYSTVIPILGAEQTARLRARTKVAAGEIAGRLRPEIKQFVGLLDSEGMSANAFSVLFSYVVDGLAWQKFREQGWGVSTRITPDTPLWAGAVWAVYPPRGSRCGTNSYSNESGTASVNWSEKALAAMGGLLRNSASLKIMLSDVAATGRLEDRDALDALSDFGVVDASGRPLIPVIRESEGEPLYEQAETLSSELERLTLELLPLDSLGAELVPASPSTVLIIVYHELMWDLMENLEAEQLLTRPEILYRDGEFSPSDAAALTFLVVSGE